MALLRTWTRDRSKLEVKCFCCLQTPVAQFSEHSCQTPYCKHSHTLSLSLSPFLFQVFFPSILRLCSSMAWSSDWRRLSSYRWFIISYLHFWIPPHPASAVIPSSILSSPPIFPSIWWDASPPLPSLFQHKSSYATVYYQFRALAYAISILLIWQPWLTRRCPQVLRYLKYQYYKETNRNRRIYQRVYPKKIRLKNTTMFLPFITSQKPHHWAKIPQRHLVSLASRTWWL